MRLDFYNASGEVLPLSSNKYFNLLDMDGQTTAQADISSLVVGGIDGDTVNNIQAQPRTITLDLRIKKGVNVEEAKRAILDIVKLKRNGTLQWTQNDRTVVITGKVESVDMPRWNNSVMMQISLHCEQPFWEDVENAIQQINEAINLHYFTTFPNDMLYFPVEGIPFGEYDMSRTREFNNKGDVAVGMDIEIVAYGHVTNPIIYNADGEFFGIGYGTGSKQVEMYSGDIIKISTHKGNKNVELNDVSIISKVKPNSTWLQLEAGRNTFSINSEEAATNNMTFNVLFKQRYI